MIQQARLPQIIAYVVAAILMVLLILAQNVLHQGPNADDAPMLLGAAAIFYIWATVSLVTGKCQIKGCPPGGFTPEDSPGNYWFGIYALYSVCGMWLWASTKM
jgi:hypothetical protein